MLPDADAGREDTEILVPVYPQQPRRGHGHISINYDITNIMMMHQELGEFMLTRDREQSEPEKIINVNDVLDELIQQSVALVGKPAALMNKDDKIRAIRFLSDAGAFLVTKSGDKVAKYFGISKYTLYSYIDANKQQEEKKHG